MNLQDLNQVTTPAAWKARAMGAQPAPTPARGIPKKKLILAVAIILCLCCGTTVAARISHQYENGTIVADVDAMIADVEAKGSNSFGYSAPNSSEAFTQEEMVASRLEKTQSWTTDALIGGTMISTLNNWDSIDAITADGPIWERHIYDAHKNVKIEFVSESPLLLLDRQAEYASWDLSWMESQYESLPYGNLTCRIEDKKGNFLGCYFSAFYLHGEEGYIDLNYAYTIEHINWANDYVISGNYDQAEEYTAPSGLKCILTEKGNQIWVSAQSPHFSFSIYAGNMDFAAIKDVLAHLNLQVELAPAGCGQEP